MATVIPIHQVALIPRAIFIPNRLRRRMLLLPSLRKLCMVSLGLILYGLIRVNSVTESQGECMVPYDLS